MYRLVAYFPFFCPDIKDFSYIDLFCKICCSRKIIGHRFLVLQSNLYTLLTDWNNYKTESRNRVQAFSFIEICLILWYKFPCWNWSFLSGWIGRPASLKVPATPIFPVQLLQPHTWFLRWVLYSELKSSLLCNSTLLNKLSSRSPYFMFLKYTESRRLTYFKTLFHKISAVSHGRLWGCHQIGSHRGPWGFPKVAFCRCLWCSNPTTQKSWQIYHYKYSTIILGKCFIDGESLLWKHRGRAQRSRTHTTLRARKCGDKRISGVLWIQMLLQIQW